MKKYIITCPKCKSTFDVELEIAKWKRSLKECSRVLDQIKELNKMENLK